jgi:hypothetical protein
MITDSPDYRAVGDRGCSDMAVITMSERKLGRLRVLIDVADGKLSVTDPEWPRRTVRGSSLAAAE